ncbi:MAG: AbrB/MazE/SpoVT family DNA-binding domain-containing protein [Chitinophagaceae bacterium]
MAGTTKGDKLSAKSVKSKKASAKSKSYSSASRIQRVQEPLANYKIRAGAAITSKIRAIGNSKGVILNSQLMEAAGISADADIIIRADKGKIVIEAIKEDVNTNLSSWDKQFKQVIKTGAKPEKDFFGGMENKFDKKEW